jgi:predicted NBD/HSP70 family sugar kinase
VDHSSGEVLSRDSLRNWPPIPPNVEFASRLARALEAQQGIPGFLGNDAQLGAWGAYCSKNESSSIHSVRGRVGPDRQKLIFVKVSDAIRVGFVNGGEPDWGCGFPSGDFSHQIVRGLGPLVDSRGGEIECPSCKTPTCLATVASGPFVKERVHKALSGSVPLPLSAIVDESNRRDPVCMGVVESAGIALGRAIVDFITVAGYDEIVLGGILSSADVLLGAVQEEIRNSLGPSVHVAPQPKLAVARGAIELARSKTRPLFLSDDQPARLGTAEGSSLSRRRS